jgi:hypothetical protein
MHTSHAHVTFIMVMNTKAHCNILQGSETTNDNWLCLSLRDDHKMYIGKAIINN